MEDERKKVWLNALQNSIPALFPVISWLYKPFKLWKMITTIVTIFTTLFFLFYSLGYCFIYGYYFSGDITDLPSLINVTINPVPINFYSIVIISCFLFLSSISLISLVGVRKFKFPLILTVIIPILALLHIGLSMFFVPGQDVIVQVKSFLPIWFVPIVLVVLISSLKYQIKHPFLFLIGTTYSLALILILLNVFQYIDNNVVEIIFTQYNVYVVILIFFLASIFVVFFQKKYKHFNSIFILLSPITLLLMLIVHGVIYNLINGGYPRNIGNIVAVIFSIIISIKLSRFIRYKQLTSHKKVLLKRRQETDQSHKSSFLSLDSTKPLTSVIFCIVPCFVILTCSITAYISVMAGNYVRFVTPIDFRKLDIITDYRENISVKGNIVKIEGDKYYISNEKWQLEILKSDHIHVRRVE